MRKLPELSEEIIQQHLDYCRDKLLFKLEELQKNHPRQQTLKKCIQNFDVLIVSKDLNFLKKEYRNLVVSKNKQLSKILKEVVKIFLEGYTNFSTGTTKWGRHQLFSSLKLTTCPYCDRQYITSYIVERNTKKKEKDFKTTADADHFYPKAKYPFLSLNIYNLIPSCQICNSRMKSDEDLQFASSPYEKAFQDEIKFVINMKETDCEKVMPTDVMDFDIDIESNGNLATEEYLKTFKIREVYKTSHNGYVKNMIETFESHPETYLAELENLLDLEGMKEEREHIRILLKEMLKNPYTHKIKNKEPLGKLTNDILKSYGILEEDE